MKTVCSLYRKGKRVACLLTRKTTIDPTQAHLIFKPLVTVDLRYVGGNVCVFWSFHRNGNFCRKKGYTSSAASLVDMTS